MELLERLPDQHVKETLSKCFLEALFAASGAYYQITEARDFGVDGDFGKARVRLSETGSGRRLAAGGPKINFQLKSTSAWNRLNDGRISYRLERKNYNDIVIQNAKYQEFPYETPMLLFVLCLPPGREEQCWIEHTDECLALYDCMYWAFLTGEETRVNGPTIYFNPDRDRITVEKLQWMMDHRFEGGLRDALA